MSLYEQQFQEVHQLLKNHGCKPTFDFQKDYQSPVLLGRLGFYKPEQEMHSDEYRKEWEEDVDAKLDVCVPTKKGYSERDKVRFDIAWSVKAKQYCMYVSLPTSARSVSLSLKRFDSEKELMVEVGSWLAKTGCKRAKKIEVREPVVNKSEVKKIEQIALF